VLEVRSVAEMVEEWMIGRDTDSRQRHLDKAWVGVDNSSLEVAEASVPVELGLVQMAGYHSSELA